ncbi:hypothetical protein PPERSA_01190 [Pseudocohnilembus persalinus]|uniref:Transmembrane protein n=1 Tax=Pseudocohnilembus persalinus TaxID=266149 RepID=A0A0V0R170_PSEPJ|nr:hypothetical protein PPERSA_01190 [Pseudocohnilembus persalinus]|eukprot:KRX08260.1 hypothetical protein PPERSA_01190 [Pseudocohnilembus persalinus]
MNSSSDNSMTYQLGGLIGAASVGFLLAKNIYIDKTVKDQKSLEDLIIQQQKLNSENNNNKNKNSMYLENDKLKEFCSIPKIKNMEQFLLCKEIQEMRNNNNNKNFK